MMWSTSSQIRSGCLVYFEKLNRKAAGELIEVGSNTILLPNSSFLCVVLKQTKSLGVQESSQNPTRARQDLLMKAGNSWAILFMSPMVVSHE
jgi:hypothetical protein